MFQESTFIVVHHSSPTVDAVAVLKCVNLQVDPPGSGLIM